MKTPYLCNNYVKTSQYRYRYFNLTLQNTQKRSLCFNSGMIKNKEGCSFKQPPQVYTRIIAILITLFYNDLLQDVYVTSEY